MRTVLLCGAAVFGSLALSGCGGDAATQTADGGPPAGSLIPVDTATLEVPLAIPGQLYVEHDALVYARSQGIVDSIYADLGTRVQKGRMLAQLENTAQEIALEEAKQTYANAQRVVERNRELAGMGVVAVADSEAAELAYQRAALAVRQAQRDYDLTRVTAPFAGVVTARTVRAGRLVGEGDSLFRVTALRPLLVSVRVPEAAAASVSVGSKGEVVGIGGQAVDAVAQRASPIIDAASGTREVILRLADGTTLSPGASVTVRLGAEARKALVIPGSVVTEGGYVLVWESGRAVLRPVTLGAALGDGRIEVMSGLGAGEQIVRPGP